MANNQRHSFSECNEFDEAIRKIVAIPKPALEKREVEWKAARKKRKRIKRASGKL